MTAGRLLAGALLLPALLLGQDPVAVEDSADGSIPRGLGRLNQDEIALRLRSGSLELRFVPLDERVTRLLAPDAERALLALLASRQEALDSAAERHAVRGGGVVLLTAFARDNNTAFDPQLVTLVVRGRVLQPAAILALSPGFSAHVLDQRRQAMGLLLYEEPIPVTEPFAVEYRDARTEEWERRLPRLDRERTRILARLATGEPPGDP
jgi:hypothetical protein